MGPCHVFKAFDEPHSARTWDATLVLIANTALGCIKAPSLLQQVVFVKSTGSLGTGCWSPWSLLLLLLLLYISMSARIPVHGLRLVQVYAVPSRGFL